MENRQKHSALSSMIFGMAGASLAIMSYMGDKYQRKREKKEFDKIDSSNMSPRQVWDKALEFGRNERLDLRTELRKADEMLGTANEICEVVEGFRKCGVMIHDVSIPRVVKEGVLKHWVERFAKVYGMSTVEDVAAIFSDEKLVERVTTLANAQEQYANWIEKINKKTPDSDDESLKCSFCGKTQKEVSSLIAGADAHICDECIETCSQIIEVKHVRKTKAKRNDQASEKRSDNVSD